MPEKIRRMKVELSCKRKGQAPHGFTVEWNEPEEKALETFSKFRKRLDDMLKEHGLGSVRDK
jgi:hypothetical protein